MDEFDKAKKAKRIRLCSTISEEVYNRFKEHCDSAGYDSSKLVEVILTKYLNVKGGKNNDGK